MQNQTPGGDLRRGEGTAWAGEGNTPRQGRGRRGLPLGSRVRQGAAFLSFPGERLLEPAQNTLSEEAPGLVDTL